MATISLTFPVGTVPSAVNLTALYGSPTATTSLPLAFAGPTTLTDGRERWTATFAGSATSYAYDATATIDGAVIALGTTGRTVAGDGVGAGVAPSVPITGTLSVAVPGVVVTFQQRSDNTTQPCSPPAFTATADSQKKVTVTLLSGVRYCYHVGDAGLPRLFQTPDVGPFDILAATVAFRG